MGGIVASATAAARPAPPARLIVTGDDARLRLDAALLRV